MRLKVVLTPDRRVLVSALDGSFPQARARIEALLAELGVDGVELVPETAVEQHRHAAEEASLHDHVTERASGA
jgi:hypothetical protein